MIKKAVITNLKTGRKMESLSTAFPSEEFQTLEEFTDAQAIAGIYGLGERWVNSKDIPEGVDLSSLENRDGEGGVEYKFPQEFSVEYFDVTEEIEDKEMNSNFEKDDAACAEVKNLIRRYNKKHMESNDIMSLMSNPSFFPILFAIQFGAVPQLRAAIEQVGPSIYPSEMVAKALAILDARIAERPV